MGMKIAGPEIEFAMNTTGAEAASKRLGVTVDAATAASIRAYNKLQREVDAYVDRLERETAAMGMNAQQIKAAQAAALLLRAEQSKDSGLVARLKAAEQAQYDAQFAAMRHAQALEQEAAEARLLDQQLQSAAAAHQAFERAAAAGMRALNDQVSASERYATSLEGQVAAIGRTTAELKHLEIAQRAADADAAGRSDIGDRIRASGAAMAAAAEEAKRLASAELAGAAAADKAAAAHARLAAAVQASNAADEADAAALERLRRSIDPARAAMEKLNAEVAESTRLFHAGKTAPAEYAQQQQVLAQRINQARAAQEHHNRIIKGGAGTMTQLSFQLNDVATMAAMGAKPMQIFASQAGQIFQIAQMAEGGIKGFAKQVGALALRFAPLIAVTAVAAVAFSRWQDQVNDDAKLKKYAEGLGLTRKEMKKLGDVSVTTGDLMAGLWDTLQDRLGTEVSGKKIIDYLFSPSDAQQVGQFIAEIYGLFVGGYKGIRDAWALLPAALKDIFIRTVNGAAEAIEALVNKSINAVNALAKGANGLLGTDLFGQIDQVQIGRLTNEFAGAGAKVGKALGDQVRAETKVAMKWMTDFVGDAAASATERARKRVAKQAAEIIADRTPKTDRHAESLMREAEAIEAQIRNLYRLAEAYRVSDAAALIAEARVKAESAAIKKKGDIEAFVSRQVRLAVAQRVSDAAKSAAAMSAEADAQAAINRDVIAGLVPQERMADALRDRLALLPLIAAQQAALATGNTADAARATAAIEQQIAAQKKLADARRESQFISSTSQADDQLALLREEMRLVGATDRERVRALATLKATQEARQLTDDPARAKAYVAQQVTLAEAIDEVRARNEAYNESLLWQADLFGQIDDNANRMASSLANAFGGVGDAIGGVMTALTGYAAEQERIIANHDAQLRAAESLSDAQEKAAKIARADKLFELQSSANQLEMMGSLASSAKGFFKEHSAGYKAMVAAEKVLAAAQLARTAIDVAGGAAQMFSTMGPLGFAGVGAMLAVMASLGFSSSGNAGSAPRLNEGRGTVLGDSDAQSRSIERAIDLLRDVDTVTMQVSRQMLESLRSIEANLGGLSSLIVRTGDVNADAGITTGFKTNAAGRALAGDFLPGVQLARQIPIIGDLVGALGGVIKGLFGTKTTITASGLFGGPQAIADVLNAGFNASYFSDVKKTKKIFGLSAGSKYSTQFVDASGEIEQQFTTLLRSFYETISAAAPALGAAASDFEARLNGFVVDLGRIDLKDLTGEEIQEKLSAVFGAAADDMARAAMPGLERFQAVGEGYFETLIRVANTTEAVAVSLGSLGANARNLGIDTSMALAGLFEDVAGLQSAAQAYFETYFTEAEQTALKTQQLTDALGRFGLSMPDSIASYRQLVEAQDLSTASGREAYAALLQLAPAFADLKSAAQDAASAAAIVRERQDLEREYLQLTGNTTALRALELSQLDASNRALKERNWALADEQAATEAAAQAAEQAAAAERQRLDGIATQRAGLERQLLEALGDTAALRALELADIDPLNRSLRERLFILEDERTATERASAAAAEAAQREQALADQRAGFDRQILELQGDTAAIRALEMAALDDSLRPLQQRVYAIRDEQAAAQEAVRIAEEAAQRQRTIADERAGLERQILEATGDTAAIRALELSLVDPLNRDLRARLFALEDERTALERVTAAAAEAAQRAQALAEKRAGLERQILDLTGDTAAVRALELAELEEVLRPLQLHIYALRDQAEATAAAAQAAEQAAATQKAIADEGAGLMSRIWQLTGDTAAIRAAEMAGTNEANRAALARIFALEDEQKAQAAAAEAMAEAQRVAEEAARAAEQLADAWRSIGDSLMEEVRRIRGETMSGAESFAVLQGRFNAATIAARGGDQEAARSLTDLSRAVLEAAGMTATSRQELDRVRAMTAASLEQTAGLIGWVANAGASITPFATVQADDNAAWWAKAATMPSERAAPSANDNAGMLAELRALRAELAKMRDDNNRGHAATAANTGSLDRRIERVQAAGGGDAFAVAGVAGDPIEVKDVAA